MLAFGLPFDLYCAVDCFGCTDVALEIGLVYRVSLILEQGTEKPGCAEQT
jgi:hypothetical protein